MSDSENKNSKQIIELDFDFNDEVKVVSEAFFKESQEILEDLDEHILKLESQPTDEVLLQGLFRKLHTLKGSAGAVPGGQLFGSLSHEFETLLDRLRKQNIPPNKDCIEIFLHSSRLLKVLAENLRMNREIYPEELSEVIELISRYGSFQLEAVAEQAASTVARAAEVADEPALRQKDGIWFSKDQMGSLVQLSSEFIVLKNALLSLTSAGTQSGLAKLQEKQSELSRSLSTLSDQFQNILDRAQKVALNDALAGLFPLVRQAAYELGKEVNFVDRGFDLEIDKGLAQDLSKALMHMVRNSIDHGLEKPEDRLASGKEVQGKLMIDVEEKNAFIFCKIIDDGRGLDRDRIVERALAKGLTNTLQATQLSEEQIFAFIFHPGFSTKEKITTMSGRGVGMDVVQNMVNKYAGRIHISSKKNVGTEITIQLPIPRKLLVERCMLTQSGNLALAFPISDVASIRSCAELKINQVDHLRFCQYDDRTVSLLGLEEFQSSKIILSTEQVKKMSVVFLKIKDATVGFLVDKINHQTDLVIKPFGKILKNTAGFKGNSVLTDDQIAYVVDIEELTKFAQKETA